MALFAWVLAWNATARAEPNATGWRLGGQAGGGMLLSADQVRSEDSARGLGFSGSLLGAALDFAYAVAPAVAPVVHVAGNLFPAQDPSRPLGALMQVGAGVRFELAVSDSFSLEPQVLLAAGWTGSLTRPLMQVDLSAVYRLTDSFGLGPSLSYSHVFQVDGRQFSDDAIFVSVGLRFVGYERSSTRPPPESPPPRVRPSRRPTPHALPTRYPPDAPSSEENSRLIELALHALPLEAQRIELLPPALFEFDSDHLVSCGEASLYEVLEIAAQRTDRIWVEGHSDTTGAASYNVELSLRRATAVREWLIAHGVDAHRIEVTALGESDPLSADSEPQGRALERRVRIRLGAPDSPRGAP